MNKKSICYVSGLCGSGKTHAACNFIVDQIGLRNFVFVAPTIALLEDVRSKLDEYGVKAELITSSSHEKNVKKSIIDALGCPPEFGKVLLITHNAYFDLPFRPNKERWQFIIDEIPAVDWYRDIKVSRHWEAIDKDFEIGDPLDDKLSRLKLRNHAAIDQHLSDKTDDTVNGLRDLYVQLQTEKDVFVDTVDWNRCIQNRVPGTSNHDYSISIISMVRPELFEGAIIMGANLEDTLLFDWLKRFHGRTLVPFHEIQGRLRTPVHSSERLKVFYLLDRPASKHGYKSLKDGISLIDRLDQKALELLGPDAHFIVNNDRGTPAGFNPDHRIPVICHGSNEYDHVTKIYIPTALNRTPKHSNMMQRLGFTKEQVHRATGQEIVYQGVMRTSLRREDYTSLVMALVPDAATARRLAQLISGTSIEKIHGFDAESFTPLNSTEKARRQATKRLQLHSSKAPKIIPHSISLKEDSIETGTFESEGKQTIVDVTLHTDLKANLPNEFVVQSLPVSKFVARFKTLSMNPQDRKGDGSYYCPSVFDPTRSEGYRKNDNFKSASFLVLDFDNGTMTPDVFSSIFWDNAAYGKKRSHIIFNTFSRTDECPNHFRVIMFFRKKALSIAAYEAAWDAVEERIVEAGFDRHTCGLDPTSRTPTHTYFVPCTNRLHSDMWYFKTYGVKERELQRCSIDPNDLLRIKSSIPLKPIPVKQFDDYLGQTVQQILAPLVGLTEGRHVPIFQAVKELIKLGLSGSEVEKEIYSVQTPNRRIKKKVGDAIKSCQKYRNCNRQARSGFGASANTASG